MEDESGNLSGFIWTKNFWDQNRKLGFNDLQPNVGRDPVALDGTQVCFGFKRGKIDICDNDSGTGFSWAKNECF